MSTCIAVAVNGLSKHKFLYSEKQEIASEINCTQYIALNTHRTVWEMEGKCVADLLLLLYHTKLMKEKNHGTLKKPKLFIAL